MAAPTTTLATLRGRVAKKLYTPSFPILSTTTGAGNAGGTTLVDSILAPASQTEDYVRAWILFTSGTNAGTTVRCTNTTFTGTISSLTFAPATAQVATSVTYELHYKFHPVAVRDKLNEILENLRREIWLVLTDVADGDMEATGVTSWTATSSTRAKQTTGTGVVFGRQALRVTNSGANGLVTSASLFLAPNTDVFVAAIVQISSGSGDAVLELYDVTNATVIDSARVDNVFKGNALAAFTASVPATSGAIAVRLKGTSADNVIDWNCAVVLPVEDKIFAYPSTLEWVEDFSEVMYLPLGNKITINDTTNAFNVFEGPFQKWSEATFWQDPTAVTAFRLQLRNHKQIDKLLFVKGLIDYPTLSADADTTNCPDDILVDLTTADLFDDWAQEEREAGRIEVAASKEARANTLRTRISPRMRHFRPDRGKVQGTIRDQGRT